MRESLIVEVIKIPITMCAVALLLPSIVIAQTPDSRRLDALERRVQQLERKSVQAKQGVPRGKEAWRSLAIGMTKDQIKVALGEPGKIDTSERLTFWHWNYPSGGTVIFKNDLVSEITEP